MLGALSFGEGRYKNCGEGAKKFGQITPPKNGRGILGVGSTSSWAVCKGPGDIRAWLARFSNIEKTIGVTKKGGYPSVKTSFLRTRLMIPRTHWVESLATEL